MGSDSGSLIVLEYDVKKKMLVRLHQEIFGRSGVRRVVPGEYLAVDPKGRAVMCAAVEKQKFVYVMNRDLTSRLTISSPLEAHKANTLCYSAVGLDVGFENPMFACLEFEFQVETDDDSTEYAPRKVFSLFDVKILSRMISLLFGVY